MRRVRHRSEFRVSNDNDMHKSKFEEELRESLKQELRVHMKSPFWSKLKTLGVSLK